MSKEKIKKAFSLRFREACLDRKTTNQGELAKLFGVSQGMISKYWNGEKMPATDKLAEIADKLNVTMDWLCCGRQPKRPGDSLLEGLTPEQQATMKEVIHSLKVKISEKAI